ncbi:MAG TPA: SDR family oxidoreductase [Bacteroides xylanisolvens]|uniref:SDR family oxidoreductase n=1 Tax=Bacteroides xylanisolvens TaxID=371601 RepID=A0A921LJ70_9BACE|nr:SDR family oxidoreductase [Bacteroides xylanisolvens]
MNKVTIITGVSRGIGYATAKLLSGKGYRIVGNYHINDVLATQLKGEIEEDGGEIVLVKGDLCETQTVEQLVQTAIKEYGAIHVLINNASNFERESLEDITENKFLSYVRLNQISPFLLIKKCASVMKKQRYGKIVNISSTLSCSGYEYSSHYISSKSGLVGLTKALAVELAPDINVNCVMPGYIETTNLSKDSSEKRMLRLEKIPKKRIGNPLDVAYAINFLISDEADYITGHVLNVSGGLYL